MYRLYEKQTNNQLTKKIDRVERMSDKLEEIQKFVIGRNTFVVDSGQTHNLHCGTSGYIFGLLLSFKKKCNKQNWLDSGHTNGRLHWEISGEPKNWKTASGRRIKTLISLISHHPQSSLS